MELHPLGILVAKCVLGQSEKMIYVPGLVVDSGPILENLAANGVLKHFSFDFLQSRARREVAYGTD